MIDDTRSRSRRRVLAAAIALATLGVLLGVRYVQGAKATRAGAPAPKAPTATVPAPEPIEVAALAFPCWSCSESAGWPVAFRSDLDLLAPLGDGSGNAAEFFGEFAEPDGRRNGDWMAADARSLEGPTGSQATAGKKVLPPNDPLLLEAEPWCDQSTMRFYPDIFPLDGLDTRIPNYTLAMTLARSWTARGLAATDPERAMADFRRTIRLGRLLRQEGTTIIADLVGLAAIRVGAQGIYEHATRRGETALALAAAVVLSEFAPQRLLTSERITRVDLSPFVRKGPAGSVVLELPDARFETILAMAESEGEPRFRGEAILALNLVRFLGATEQSPRALAELEKLAAAGDPRLASLARWSRDKKPSQAYLESLVEQAKRGGL